MAGISNATANGNGDPAETLVNTTTAPVTVNYIYTVTAYGCTNPVTYTIPVTVYPTPAVDLTNPFPTVVCENDPVSYTFSSLTSGTTFTWSRAAVAGISNGAVVSNATGVINETLNNTTTAPVNVTYTYT